MSLYKVIIQHTLMVVADNDVAAETIGCRHVGRDGSEPDTTDATPVTSIEQVPKEWQDSLPFGGSDDRTCRQMLSQ